MYACRKVLEFMVRYLHAHYGERSWHLVRRVYRCYTSEEDVCCHPHCPSIPPESH
jgi:hypothetical protein